MNLKGFNIVSVFAHRGLLVAVAALAIATPTTGAPASTPEAWKQRQGGRWLSVVPRT